MPTISSPLLTKRSLLFRDSLTFVILTLVSGALFAMTLFLFRSFQVHRQDLGRTWVDQAQIAMQQGRPEAAVFSLRTALSYDPDDRREQLLLAQALAAAGHTEEATNYFLSLWDMQPGDGFINLELARLARKKGNVQQAITYYRASIFGNWQGDGATRRREVRLELADYLASHGDLPEARAEILTAAGNANQNDQSEIAFGDRLRSIGDFSDALNLYRKALAHDPRDYVALVNAGRLSYQTGDYTGARRLLLSALDQPQARTDTAEREEMAKLAENSQRIQELDTSRTLPASERAEHLLVAARIAHQRLKHCSLPQTPSPAQSAPAAASSSADSILLPLEGRWDAMSSNLNGRALQKDAALEDALAELIDDTEVQTANICGPAPGDDALLLTLATSPRPGNR